LIISDNASTDKTSEIIKGFAKNDPRIRYFLQERNLGATANFCFVLKNAQASNFMWAAADDIWDPLWIETLLPLVLAEPCLAFGRLTTIDARGNKLPHPADDRLFSFTGSSLRRRLRYFLMPALNGKANPIYGIYRRKMISKDFLDIFTSGKRAADVLALYQMLAHHEIRPSGEVYLLKRRHDQSEAKIERSKSGTKPTLRSRFFRKSQLLDFLDLSTPVEKILLVTCYPLAWLGMKISKFQYLWLRAKTR
jgi:glycosyltransferase involved in cell wall biosynthesis